MGPICTVPSGVEAVAWSVDSSHLTEGGAGVGTRYTAVQTAETGRWSGWTAGL